MKAAALGCAALLLGLTTATPAAHAGFILTVSEVGSDVVATGSGSLDLTGLIGPVTVSSDPASMTPSAGILVIGLTANMSLYQGLSGPESFGPGGTTLADSALGDLVAIVGSFPVPVVGVPAGYSFGDPLTSGATWAGATLASLMLTPGIYAYTLPEDTFTLVVGAVPVPATLLLLVSAVAGVGALSAWRRR